MRGILFLATIYVLPTCFAALLPVVAGAQALSSQAVCPLSDQQAQRAKDAFTALVPLFLHPRCFNCHGGVSPFGDNPPNHNHEIKYRVIAKDGFEDINATFGPCENCHELAPGMPGMWRLAPVNPPEKNMQFRGRTPLQLCSQMKDIFQDEPDRFVRHMTNDEGGTPFLDIAYTGQLALNDLGTELAGADHFGLPAPTPADVMSRGEAVGHANDWVEAMDHRFYDPNECGCEVLHYGLQVKITGNWTTVVGGVGVRFDWGNPAPGASLPVIPIHFHEDGSVTSDSTLFSAQSSGNIFGLPTCSVAGRQTTQLTAQGTWVKAPLVTSEGHLEMTLHMAPVAAQGNAKCEALGISSSGSSNQAGQGMYGINLVLIPTVGMTQTVPWNVPLPGFSGAVQATLVRM